MPYQPTKTLGAEFPGITTILNHSWQQFDSDDTLIRALKNQKNQGVAKLHVSINREDYKNGAAMGLQKMLLQKLAASRGDTSFKRVMENFKYLHSPEIDDKNHAYYEALTAYNDSIKPCYDFLAREGLKYSFSDCLTHPEMKKLLTKAQEAYDLLINEYKSNVIRTYAYKLDANTPFSVRALQVDSDTDLENIKPETFYSHYQNKSFISEHKKTISRLKGYVCTRVQQNTPEQGLIGRLFFTQPDVLTPIKSQFNLYEEQLTGYLNNPADKHAEDTLNAQYKSLISLLSKMEGMEDIISKLEKTSLAEIRKERANYISTSIAETRAGLDYSDRNQTSAQFTIYLNDEIYLKLIQIECI